jgi:hypothetical protein
MAVCRPAKVVCGNRRGKRTQPPIFHKPTRARGTLIDSGETVLVHSLPSSPPGSHRDRPPPLSPGGDPGLEEISRRQVG